MNRQLDPSAPAYVPQATMITAPSFVPTFLLQRHKSNTSSPKPVTIANTSSATAINVNDHINPSNVDSVITVTASVGANPDGSNCISHVEGVALPSSTALVGANHPKKKKQAYSTWSPLTTSVSTATATATSTSSRQEVPAVVSSMVDNASTISSSLADNHRVHQQSKRETHSPSLLKKKKPTSSNDRNSSNQNVPIQSADKLEDSTKRSKKQTKPAIAGGCSVSEAMSTLEPTDCATFTSHYQSDVRNTKVSVVPRPAVEQPKKHPSKQRQRGPLKIDDEMADSLATELFDQSYECMICCDSVKRQHAVWSCSTCFHVFHIKCIQKWAGSAAITDADLQIKWRCPGCQTVFERVPKTAVCFCGKLNSPTYEPRGPAPHTCGAPCGKYRSRNGVKCEHKCNALCHPGPCPRCPVMVQQSCHCGKHSRQIRCASELTAFTCNEICDKMLNCGSHPCGCICHEGSCDTCTVAVVQSCYCHLSSRETTCGNGAADVSRGCTAGYYSCDSACNGLLGCGNHRCTSTCHPKTCSPCASDPAVVKTCPCGSTPIALLNASLRSSCLDPVPLCGGVCGKSLHCLGNSAHACPSKCHVGPCPPCQRTATLSCRCLSIAKEVPCAEINSGSAPEISCTRICGSKMSCRRHKCQQKCCVDARSFEGPDSPAHLCTLPCNRQLSCKQHTCTQTCHQGQCSPCANISYSELSCECGRTVLHPPIACGTPRPVCRFPCSRDHPCGHSQNHTCSELPCPPCPELVSKMCAGGHELRKHIPCHVKTVGCGKVCRKSLCCGFHSCPSKCHAGPCEGTYARLPSSDGADTSSSAWGEVEESSSENSNALHEAPGRASCGLKCEKIRDCGHPCQSRCHPNVGKCPDVQCMESVDVTCKCGVRSEKVPCHTVAVDPSALLDGQTIEDLTLQSKQRLKCDEECEKAAKIQRNRELAAALGLENASASSALQQEYPESLMLLLPRKIDTIKMVEEVLDQFVKDPTKKSHSFPIMKYEDRLIAHELAAIYGLSSVSLDRVPYRSVAITRNPYVRVVTPSPLLSQLYTTRTISLSDWASVKMVPYASSFEDI